MYLTLEIVSPNGKALGENRQIVVGEQGVQIGRGRSNDWVIDDPYISREQARIRYLNGAFYLEGIGINPVALNDPQSIIPNNEPQILLSGARFFLDNYEIKATVAAGQRAAAVPVMEDPFSDDPTPAPAPQAVPASPWDVSPEPVAGGAGPDDVLKAFGIMPVATDEPTLSPVDLNQISPIHENFVPRPLVHQKPTPGPPRSERARPQVVHEEDWDHTQFVPNAPATSHQPVVPPPIVPAPVVQQRPGPGRPQPPRPRITEFPDPPAPSPVAYRVESPSLAELLRAAGVKDGQLSPEIAAELGAVFRIMVQGVRDALQARALVKSEFRIQATRMQAHDNNPLKFSANVEDALHTLLVERNRGYLSAPRAFQDAFNDLRDHQIAILAGVRAGFNAMLAQFDPRRLQEKLDSESKRGLLKGGRVRFQEFYTEYYRTLTGDPDECFGRLFGEVFAESYETQLESLKRAGGPPRD
jgi:type VI secretion system FHA domain protein